MVTWGDRHVARRRESGDMEPNVSGMVNAITHGSHLDQSPNPLATSNSASTSDRNENRGRQRRLGVGFEPLMP